MAGSERKLTVVIAGDAKGAQTAFKQTEASAESAGGKFSKMGTAAKVALAGAGLAAIGFAKDSIGAYMDAEASQAQLNQAFEKFPQLAGENTKALQALNTELEKKTVFDDDATASGQAVLAGFGLTESQLRTITPLLQDYAAKTGKDLPTAARDLGKAVDGQGKALKNVGIQFKDTGDKGKNFDEIVQGLGDHVGGFAENQGDTAAGKMKILGNEFGELQEKVGSKLVPVLMKLADVGLGILNWFDRLGPSGKIVLGVVAGLAGTILVVVEAVKAWTAVQAAFNLVMDANPIVLVVLAIAGLVAGLVIAYEKVGWFRDLVNGAFQAIQLVVDGVVNFIRDHWQLLIEILTGPIGIAVGLITSHWDTIKNGFTAVKDWIAGRIDDVVGFFTGLPGRVMGSINSLWEGIKSGISTAKTWVGDRVSDMVGFITGMPGRITSAARGMWDGIYSAFKAVLNSIISKWNAFKFPSITFHIPHIPGTNIGGDVTFGGWSLPQIKPLALGGIVPAQFGGMLAKLGEAGSSEAVIPLNRQGLAPIVDAVRQGLAAPGPIVVNVYIEGSVQTEANLIDAVRRGIDQVGFRNGFAAAS